MPVLINGLTSIYKFVFKQKQSVLGRNIPIISPDDPQNESFYNIKINVCENILYLQSSSAYLKAI